MLVAGDVGGTKTLLGLFEAADPRPTALATHTYVTSAFASFTVAAATALLYLYEDRRLSRRDTRLLRLRLPSLEGLERLASRAALAGLCLLSAGIVVGLAWLSVEGLDAAMTVTVAIWAFYGLTLLLRREAGLLGRRLAWALVSGALLVAVVLPLTHFAA